MGVVGVGLMAWLLNPRAWLALALAALLGYHFYAVNAAEKRGFAAGDKAGACGSRAFRLKHCAAWWLAWCSLFSPPQEKPHAHSH